MKKIGIIIILVVPVYPVVGMERGAIRSLIRVGTALQIFASACGQNQQPQPQSASDNEPNQWSALIGPFAVLGGCLCCACGIWLCDTCTKKEGQISVVSAYSTTMSYGTTTKNTSDVDVNLYDKKYGKDDKDPYGNPALYLAAVTCESNDHRRCDSTTTTHYVSNCKNSDDVGYDYNDNSYSSD